MCSIVLGPYDVLVYTGRGTCSGLGKGRMRCWDNRRAPNSQRGLPLKILIALHYDIKKGQVVKVTYRLNFGEFPFHALG